MNTIMIDTPYGIRVTDNDEILSQALKSLVRNNTFCPNIRRVVYGLGKVRNDKSHRNDYTLATTVFFADGTRVTVKNTVNDKISVVKEKIKLSDGTEREVETASQESREIGLVYAILKRLIGRPDEKGDIKGNGFASFLRNTVKNAWNQSVEEVRTAAEKEISKTRAKDFEAKAKSKKDTRKPSLRDCVAALSDIIGKLDKKIK